MENEGIMSLPGMQGMDREPRGAAALQYVSSADAYDAATQALDIASPGASAPYRQSIRNKIGRLNLSPQQLGQLVLLVEFLLQDPSKYASNVRKMIDAGILKEGQLPAEFDPQFLGVIMSVLQETRMMQAEGAQPPEMPGMPPIQMAEGGLTSVAQHLQSMGRNGDTMLAHITPEEAALLKRMGGSGTINPDTGLPEFFFKQIKQAVQGLGNIFQDVVDVAKDVVSSPIGKIAATIALAMVLGPAAAGGLGIMSTPMAAMTAGAVTGGLSGGLKGALIGGALGYVGGGGDFGGLGSPLQGLSGILPGAAGSALNTGLTYGALGTVGGLATGMNPRQALTLGALSGLGAGALQGISNVRLAGPEAPAGAPAGAPTGAAGAAPGLSPIHQAAGAPGVGDLTIPTAGEQLSGGIGSIGTADELMMSELMGQPGLESIPTADLQTPASQATQGAQVDIGGRQYEMPSPDTTPYSDTMDARNLLRAQGKENIAAGGSFDRPALTGVQQASSAGGKGMIDRMGDFFKDPSFDNFGKVLVDPNATSFIGKYGPGAALVGAGLFAGGAFKTPPEDMTAANQARRPYPTPDPSRGTFARPQPVGSNVLVPTPGVFPGSMPAPTPPVYLPTGITNQPQGVTQPYNMAGLYNVPRQYRDGGTAEYPRKTGAINGPGTGTSDSIPAMLSDGEFVFTAKAVRNAGGGSRRKGAKRMYKLMRSLESGGMVKG